MLLCYITARSQFPGDEHARRARLLEKAAEAAECGVDFIQLRENDLAAGELEDLAREIAGIVNSAPPAGRSRTRLLVNSRTDVAIAAGAAGVHLRSGDVSPEVVRKVWHGNREQPPVISIATHSMAEVSKAAGVADLVLFAPVFEKLASPAREPVGLDALREACQFGVPVLALGGVTVQNAFLCTQAGAAGIAAIRLFQENRIQEVVDALRG